MATTKQMEMICKHYAMLKFGGLQGRLFFMVIQSFENKLKSVVYVTLFISSCKNP